LYLKQNTYAPETLSKQGLHIVDPEGLLPQSMVDLASLFWIQLFLVQSRVNNSCSILFSEIFRYCTCKRWVCSSSTRNTHKAAASPWQCM